MLLFYSYGWGCSSQSVQAVDRFVPPGPLRNSHPTDTAKGCCGAARDIVVVTLVGHNTFLLTGVCCAWLEILIHITNVTPTGMVHIKKNYICRFWITLNWITFQKLKLITLNCYLNTEISNLFNNQTEIDINTVVLQQCDYKYIDAYLTLSGERNYFSL